MSLEANLPNMPLQKSEEKLMPSPTMFKNNSSIYIAHSSILRFCFDSSRSEAPLAPFLGTQTKHCRMNFMVC